VVRVEGESGVGKSRLVRRFLEEVTWQQGEAVVLSGRCYERESLPYKGVDGLVDALAGYLGGPGRQEAAELLPEGAAALCQLFPVLAAVAPRSATPVQVEPVQARVSAFAALRELLGRLSRRRPLVLVVDDIQWADRDSLGLLEEVLAEPGLLLVATVRSGPNEPTLAQQQGRVWQEARVVELSGLLPDQSEALIRRLLLRRSKLPEEEVWRIVRESAGHPLFIDALVHQPREPGAQEQALSLEQVLWARMGLLEPAARGVLALLAVAEGALSHEVARQAAALEAAEYVRAMASLRGARLAVSSGPAASATLEVLHDKVRQAVLLHLEPPERRAWHLRLATTLETQPQPPAESLARHWREVGRLERAAQYYRQAAREAEQVLAFSRAAQLYQVLLELQPWEPQERSRLLVARGEALACAGHGAEAALALLAAAEHSPHAQALQLRAGSQYLLVGHFEQGMALVRQTLARQGLALARGPATALLSLLWQRLWIRPPSRLELREEVPAHTLERLELLDSLQQGLTPVSPFQGAVFQASYVRLALRTRERHHLLRALGHEVLFAATLDSRQRLARWSELLEQVEAHLSAEPSARAYAAVVRTLCAAILGECRRAQRSLEGARELLRQCTGLYRERCMLSGFGFWCLCMAGEIAEFRREAALALAEARERGDLYTYVALSLYAAPLRRLSEGEVAGMRREVDELLAQCRLTGFSTQHLHHLKAHVLADLYGGEPEAAVRRLEEAWPQVRRAGMLWTKSSSAELLDLRSRVLLYAAQARGAEKDARVLERLGQPYTVACAELVRAGLSALRGEPEAAARYGHAARRLEEEGMLLYAASARVRQGELLGGEQGEALVRQTCEWMRQRGILQPERVAAMYAPPTART
jgi:eukaryotic-like serine/threonine-protein kinase